MATEKKITSRIQQKHDVAANWAKATNFIPKKGEIIIYDAEYNASGEETQAVRFKIGDGSKTVNNLPFAAIDYSSDIEALKQKVANNSTAIGALQENTVPKTRKINNKALSSDITLGAADVGVNETTFPGLKKTGTITGVKMNRTTKTPDSAGLVDLGTVLTDASKFATAAQGSNADSALAKANANATEISNIKNGTNGTKVKYAEHADAADSATSAGTATKATEAMNVTENIKGHAIADIFETNGTTVKKATSAGTADKVANGLTIANATFDGSKPLTIGTSGKHIEIMGGSAASPNHVSIGLEYGKLMPSSYNKVTIDGYGFVIDGENVDYAKKTDLPDVSGKANLSGGNTFTGKQTFNNTVGGVTNQLVLNETQWDIFTCRDLTSPTTKTAVGKGSVWCQDSDAIYSQFKATGIYYGNDTSGYEGTLKFPTNISGEKIIATMSDIPTFSFSNGVLRITT